MRVLILDIETSPNLAHVWGLFKQDIGAPFDDHVKLLSRFTLSNDAFAR